MHFIGIYFSFVFLLTFSQISNENVFSLAERIGQGDVVAILEGGRTGDAEYIPMLMPLLDSPDERVRAPARLALARLGERDALQYFV
jgi:HEAT repeat protein